MDERQNRLSYSDIIKGRNHYIKLARKLGVENKLHPINRIFKAYQLLEELTPIYMDPVKSKAFYEKYDLGSIIHNVLIELSELSFIFTTQDRF